MNIDNKIIDGQQFLAEPLSVDKKKVIFTNNKAGTAATANDKSIMVDELNDEKLTSNLLSSVFSLVPVLKRPELIEKAKSQNSDALRTIASKLEQWLPAFGVEAASGKKEASYTKINEHAFAALYAKLLALFSSLDLASSKLTGLHASLAEKFAKSSGDELIEAAEAQKNQSIAMAATSMGVGGVGLALSHKGISQQQEAIKQNSIGRNIDELGYGFNNRATNTDADAGLLNRLPTASSSESVEAGVLNNGVTTPSAAHADSELLNGLPTSSSSESVEAGVLNNGVTTPSAAHADSELLNGLPTASSSEFVEAGVLNNGVTTPSAAHADSELLNGLPTSSSSESVEAGVLNNGVATQPATNIHPELLKLSGSKKTNTGQAIGGMGQHAGSLVSSGYGVEAATKNATAQGDAVAKDSMMETEVRNRENQNAARANLKALLNLIYQSMEKNNDAISHTTQMLKV